MRRRALIASALLFALPASGAKAGGCAEKPCNGPAATPNGTRLLFVHAGARGPIHAFDTRTGRRRFVLPRGIASGDARWHFSASATRATTWVTGYELATGKPYRGWTIAGGWKLAGVSPTGRWLALVRGRTQIAIVERDRGRVVHSAKLPGAFEVEAISADGRRLFLIQHLDSRRYLVRLYDVERARLKTQPLRASGEGAPMVGYAWNGIASRDGRWLLTLYLNTHHNHAFVHALDLRRAEAACVALPSGGRALTRLKSYVLTLSPDRRTLFASNPALGIVAEIDLTTLRAERVTRFAPRPNAGPAQSIGAASISRNGRTLYFSDGRDLWAYDSAYRLVRGPYPSGGRVIGFGFGVNDRTVHVLRSDGRMATLDAATGRRLR